MPRGLALGHKHFESFIIEFTAPVTEKALGLDIGQADAPFAVDDEHAIRNGVQQFLQVTAEKLSDALDCDGLS
jgi:hypothetical protein